MSATDPQEPFHWARQMASTEVKINSLVLERADIIPRKRFKTSELPLNSSQRSAIDGLLHTIKKKGEYDALRKKVWSQYIESVSAESNFTRC